MITRRATQKAFGPGKKVEGKSAKGQQLYDNGQVTRGMGSKVHTDVLPPELHTKFGTLHPKGTQLLGHSQPNGKGGGILRMNPNAAPEDQAATYKHEMAHLSPKRNPHRLAERTQNSPLRAGREEGRADFTGRGKMTPGAYPGGEDFQRGYNQVQRSMHHASKQPKKPRKFAVDSQGVAVQKSAFGVTHGKIKALKSTAKLPDYLKPKDKEPVKFPLSRNRK